MGFKCLLSDEDVNDNIKIRLFSVAAYRSSFRKVIQMVLFRNASVLDHQVLHRLICKMVTSLEGLGFQVAGVVTPGSLMDLQAMSLFKEQDASSDDDELKHPIAKRQFLHMIDPFYTLNAVWDEFINSPVEMFLFPGFEDTTHYAALPGDVKKLFEIRNWVTIKYQLGSETTFESRMRYRQVDQHMALRIFDAESFEALVNSASDLVTPNTQRFVQTFTLWWKLVSDNAPWTPPTTGEEGLNARNISVLEKFSCWFERWDEVEEVIAAKPNMCSFSDETVALLKQTTRSIWRLAHIYYTAVPKPLRPANIQLSQWRHSNMAALRAVELPVSLYQIRKSVKKLCGGELPAETLLNLDLPITEGVFKHDAASSCVPGEWELSVSVKSLRDMDDLLPLLVYIASHCAHKITSAPVMSCADCKSIYLTELPLPQSSVCPFVESLSGPDRLIPREYTVNLIIHAYAVFEKLFGSELSNVYPDVFVNRIWLTSVTLGDRPCLVQSIQILSKLGREEWAGAEGPAFCSRFLPGRRRSNLSSNAHFDRTVRVQSPRIQTLRSRLPFRLLDPSQQSSSQGADRIQ
ncbi:unnamed protein product [Nesidiocoris tenuis]|uniref:Uncharacterized protein n=1 Tax=Nesidiocoris tenuis TaxID=355587 RepID=A0A6H5G8S2_9HEMI|nr:unnamed protein product [Nesidiocoris tenuis]